MAFSRAEAATTRPDSHNLTARMTGIGMQFAAEPAERPNIEVAMRCERFHRGRSDLAGLDGRCED